MDKIGKSSKDLIHPKKYILIPYAKNPDVMGLNNRIPLAVADGSITQVRHSVNLNRDTQSGTVKIQNETINSVLS